MKSTFVFVACIFLGMAYLTPGTSAQGECPTICAAIYDPVCGYDGTEYKTFSNACQLNVINCTKKRSFSQLKKGPC